MSPASTGSVGASAAASTIAAPAERPITVVPNSAASAMNAGIPITSSRVTVLHSRQRSARSTFSPVENSAITTASSVMCSSSAASSHRVHPARRRARRGRPRRRARGRGRSATPRRRARARARARRRRRTRRGRGTRARPPRGLRRRVRAGAASVGGIRHRGPSGCGRQRVVRRRGVGAGRDVGRLARRGGVRGHGRRLGHDGLRRLRGLGDLHRHRGLHTPALPAAVRVQTLE